MADKIGHEFWQKTSFKYAGKTDQMKGLPQPDLELPYDNKAEKILLPVPPDIKIPDIGLREAIESRRSIRTYARTFLPLDRLSFLLWCTQGIKELLPGHATLRTVPSAGARHAFETLVLVNRVSDLPTGLYRFVAGEHAMVEQSRQANLAESLVYACLGQQFIKTSAVTFIWVAVAERMCWRYGERGYRYLLLDAGHVCQNLYLAAEAIDCGVCAIAAFSDEELNRILSLDGTSQFVVYLATVGIRG